MTTKNDIPGIGWIVDVQNDFMLPPEEGGRLYVKDQNDPDDPGAKAVKDDIVEAVQYMRDKGYMMVFTGDWHDFSDEEIDTENPDFQTTYPPHCMGRVDDTDLQFGAWIIPEIAPNDPLVLDVVAEPMMGYNVAAQAIHDNRDVFIRKTKFDVFEGNAATGTFLGALSRGLGSLTPNDQEIVVCGVARDVCVDQAVSGMTTQGYSPTVLLDCTWGLGLESEEETIDRWHSNGAKTITLDRGI